MSWTKSMLAKRISENVRKAAFGAHQEDREEAAQAVKNDAVVLLDRVRGEGRS